MSQNIYLVGADDVRSAGSQMASAAERMRGAADSIDSSLNRFTQLFEDYVIRMERAAELMAASADQAATLAIAADKSKESP